MKEPAYIAAICREFQKAATEVLIAKTIRAAQKYHPRSVLLAGGVSANLELRKKLGAAVRKELPKMAYYIPDTAYALDNSAMIAVVGEQLLTRGLKDSLDLNAVSRWPLDLKHDS